MNESAPNKLKVRARHYKTEFYTPPASKKKPTNEASKITKPVTPTKPTKEANNA